MVGVGQFDGEERTLNLNVFGSGEYARLVELYAQLEPVDRPPFTLIAAGGAEREAATGDALVDLVFRSGARAAGSSATRGWAR